MAETWEECCDTYCSHGGVCTLDRGHEGLHDSKYCQWSNEEAVSREEADDILANMGPAGRAMALIWDIEIPR